MIRSVYSRNKSVSYTISDDGVFEIVGVGLLYIPNKHLPPRSDKEIAVDIILQENRRIKGVKVNHLVPDVATFIMKMKHCVGVFEDAALNPYTAIGRKRLSWDFARLVEDVVIEI